MNHDQTVAALHKIGKGRLRIQREPRTLDGQGSEVGLGQHDDGEFRHHFRRPFCGVINKFIVEATVLQRAESAPDCFSGMPAVATKYEGAHAHGFFASASAVDSCRKTFPSLLSTICALIVFPSPVKLWSWISCTRPSAN